MNVREQVYCQLWHKKFNNLNFRFESSVWKDTKRPIKSPIWIKYWFTVKKNQFHLNILLEKPSIRFFMTHFKNDFYNHFSKFSVYGTRFDFIFALGQYEKRFWIEILWEKICSRINLNKSTCGLQSFFPLNSHSLRSVFSSRTASYLLKIT